MRECNFSYISFIAFYEFFVSWFSRTIYFCLFVIREFCSRALQERRSLLEGRYKILFFFIGLPRRGLSIHWFLGLAFPLSYGKLCLLSVSSQVTLTEYVVSFTGILFSFRVTFCSFSAFVVPFVTLVIPVSPEVGPPAPPLRPTVNRTGIAFCLSPNLRSL